VSHIPDRLPRPLVEALARTAGIESRNAVFNATQAMNRADAASEQAAKSIRETPGVETAAELARFRAGIARLAACRAANAKDKVLAAQDAVDRHTGLARKAEKQAAAGGRQEAARHDAAAHTALFTAISAAAGAHEQAEAAADAAGEAVQFSADAARIAGQGGAQ